MRVLAWRCRAINLMQHSEVLLEWALPRGLGIQPSRYLSTFVARVIRCDKAAGGVCDGAVRAGDDAQPKRRDALRTGIFEGEHYGTRGALSEIEFGRVRLDAR